MMIAVILSANTKKMARDQVLVRRAVGIESAGSMNLLFTDKTGTLTEGKLSLGGLFLPTGERLGGVEELAGHSSTISELYRLSCHLNTSSVSSEGRALGGNATDRALLESVIDTPPRGEYDVRGKLPFDSEKKYSAISLGGRETMTLFKGAPERLLPFVRFCYAPDGRVCPFAPFSYEFSRTLASMTESGARVLLLARGDGSSLHPSSGGLTLICGVVLRDHLRREARDSVALLQGAGVQVVMITGDNRETARSIACECGIVRGANDLVLDGEELAKLSDERVRRLLPRLRVLSRALPSDKSRLVRLAQEEGLVVGMTGDGINDAPALKCADVGFAMGNGTQVAREAGDVIILDNNLGSIAKAVLYGRNIFKSIRKFITLQLLMNFCAVGVSMIGPFIGVEAPVTVVQMLWINLIMDTLGGLAFAGEAPLASYMKEKPKRRDEPILNRYMINQILFLGGYTLCLCLYFLLSPTVGSHFRSAPDRIYLLTAFFALFIFSSVLNAFSSRTDRLSPLGGLSKNRGFLLIMGAVCLIQILFVYVGGSVLRTAPLTLGELLYTLALSLTVVPAELLRRGLWRMRGKKTGF